MGLTNPRKARKFRTQPAPSVVLGVLFFISKISVGWRSSPPALCYPEPEPLYRWFVKSVKCRVEGISGDLILHEDSGSKVVRLSLAYTCQGVCKRFQERAVCSSSAFLHLRPAAKRNWKQAWKRAAHCHGASHQVVVTCCLMSWDNEAVAGELSKCSDIDSVSSRPLHLSDQKKSAVVAKAVLISLFEFASHNNSSGPRIIYGCFQE